MVADLETPPEMAADPSHCSSTEVCGNIRRLPAAAKAAILVAWHPRCRLHVKQSSPIKTQGKSTQSLLQVRR